MTTLVQQSYGSPRRSLIERLVDGFFAWQERANQRHALESLSDHELKDIGLTRADATGEASKHFWQV